nr:MAG TPA: Aalpha helical domain protein [Caudoviricetes sp.]
MIDLTGKRVFVKAQEEYLSVLKIAKFQGFTWARENHLDPIEIPFPNILNFNDSKIVTYSYNEKTLYEASEIVKDEEKLNEAIAHVKYFANNKDRMSLTDKVVESMLLLADTVESQMEEVK